MIAKSKRHDIAAPALLNLLVVSADDCESDALVILESVVLGVVALYRPDPKQAAEFLDVMTQSVIERMSLA